MPWPASSSMRTSSGLPLVDDASIRAAILPVIHGATRLSFKPIVKITAGDAVAGAACWDGALSRVALEAAPGSGSPRSLFLFAPVSAAGARRGVVPPRPAVGGGDRIGR